ncbi:MAG: hypothetical protein Q7S95_03080 [bacterium]|nr:hypothetical protein [bacterium]
MDTTMTSGQLALQIKLFKEKGMTPERWGRILANGAFADLCDSAANISDRNVWRDALGLGGLIPETFILEIDYTKLPKFMRMPHDLAAVDIPTFKVRGDGTVQVEARAFDFGIDGIKTPEIRSRIRRADRKYPWSLGRIEHLDAFEHTFPKTRGVSHVVALGSVAKTRYRHHIPLVWMAEIPHRLYSTEVSSDPNNTWNAGCRFLAVRSVRLAA